MEVLGASVASLSISTPGSDTMARGQNEVLEKGGWRLEVTAAGEMASFTDGRTELINRRLGDTRPVVVVGGVRVYRCGQATVARREGSTLVFRYRLSEQVALEVDHEISLIDLSQGAVALKQGVAVRSGAKINESVKLMLPRSVQLPQDNRKVFLPLKNGIGRRKPVLGLESNDEYVFSFAGGYEAMGKPQLLAIPMVDEFAECSDLHLTLCADPFFTSFFFLPYEEKIGQFNCVYANLEGTEERTLYTGLHRGDARTAMQIFYSTSLADVKPGPDWLHDVAMVDYDYLSKNGAGWFRDVDKLTELLAPSDRAKVFLALHGCYDYLGRYAFDPWTRSFDKEWTAFPSALDPKVQSLGEAPDNGTGYRWREQSVKALRPTPMSLADMHRRVRYAKGKGFRVGVYFADGTRACDGVKDIYDPQKVFRWGGWVGPDTKGRTYTQSPLHPGVRQFYLDYARALLEEFGKEVDGFIWDETFMAGPHEMGPEPYPGYAGRAMMTLVREVTAAVESYSPQLAFLASDCIGLWYRFEETAPCCLVAHGTYQDSWCAPVAWPYGLFPNYRNVLWSCNWAPVTRFPFTRYGVETFGVPVAISNGAWGDDIGISDMAPEQVKRTMELFEKRKTQRMEISWIEEDRWSLTYQGKEVQYKWNL
jgi:hypothetical protein